MKEVLKALGFMIIGAAIGLLIFGKKIQENIKDQYAIKTDTVYELQVVKDTVWKEIETEQPAELVEVIKHDTIYKDCQKIANLYSEEKTYEQVFEDSLLAIEVQSKVFQNVLIDQSLQYKLKKQRLQTITKTVEIKQPTKGLYIGLEIGGNRQNFNFAPAVSYLHDKNLIGINYDLLHRELNVSYQHSIFRN